MSALTSAALETLRVDRDGAITTIELHRPDRLNAISPQMIEDLHTVLDELAGDVSQRVVVLAGAGRAFSAGTDLATDFDDGEDGLGRVATRLRGQERLADLTVRLREIPQPVIAAVHGAAAGGGFALAAACDIRVVDDTARFNAAFVRVGLSGGDVGLSWLLPRLVGASAASELMLTGRFVDAVQARRIGLVSRVVLTGEHRDAARCIAEEILANAPLGVRMTKSLLSRTFESGSLRAQVELENRTQVLCTLTDDFEEATTAFLDKRPPTFRDA